jgi:RimJ/RimL family protein N-acetyltransferase
VAEDPRLGAAVDWTPARRPAREPAEGRYVRIEPFADSHRDALFASLAAGGPDLWTHLPYGPFAARDWRKWFAAAGARDDPLFFAIVDRASGLPVGQGSYLRIEPRDGTIEVGHLAFGPQLQRTRGATEVVYLLARRAFDELGYRRLEWKCNALNARSRAAAERLGFEFEGVFRQHMVVKGRNRDTAWYAIVDGDWPAVRAAFEDWLAPGNFDEAGRQRRSLRAMRARAPAADRT